jgi:hypothetical protein
MSSAMDEYAELRRGWIAEGKRLTLAGEYSPLSQIDQKNVMLYRREQRRRVDRRGQCESRCSVELVQTMHGEWVCPHTWRPCPNRVLSSIVSLLAKVNG